MVPSPVRYTTPVTLVGHGGLDAAAVQAARALAPVLVAADGGADALGRYGLVPDLVVGDMDSLPDPERWAGRTQILTLAEQDTTDFEKCLYATEAPCYIAVGFTGRRLDHTLAVLHALLRRTGKRVLLLGEHEAMALLPAGRTVRLHLDPGERVSLYPLLPAQGTISEGLEWPLAGLALAPGTQIATSNRATARDVAVAVDGPGVLLMLERARLGMLSRALWQG